MLVFFDIDETLLDRRKAEIAAAEHFLEKYRASLRGIETPADFCQTWRRLREQHLSAYLRGQISYREYRRRRIRGLFAESEPWLEDFQADARFALFGDAYRNAWSLFDDVLECLRALGEISLGVISNGSSLRQRQKLGRTGIADRFRTIVISEEVGAAKPAPTIFQAACLRAGCSPRQCIYVGDELDLDAHASRVAGMRSIWLNRSGVAAETEIESISTLAELPRRIHALEQHEPACGNAGHCM